MAKFFKIEVDFGKRKMKDLILQQILKAKTDEIGKMDIETVKRRILLDYIEEKLDEMDISEFFN